MTTTTMGIARFKSAVTRGVKLPTDLRVLKTMSVKIEPAAGERRKTFTISTEAVDRDNDTISLKGWMLDSFIRSPVVFFNHETYGYPIGKAVEIGIEGNALKSVVEFMPATIPDGAGERAESVYQQVEGGYLCSASVGFRPLEYEAAKDRMDDDDWWPPMNFLRQELMEWSVVSVPANSDATVDSDERAAIADLQKFRQEQRDSKAVADAAALEKAAAIAARRKLLRAACY